MYAVERVQVEVYALCRLGDWVSEQKIRQLQSTSIEHTAPQRQRLAEQAFSSISEWWRPAAIHDSHNRRGGRIRVSAKSENFRLCLKSPTTNTDERVPETEEPVSKADRINITSALEGLFDEAAAQDIPKEPEEVLRMIKDQYQEALYVSKVRNSIIITLPQRLILQDFLGVLCERTLVTGTGRLSRDYWIITGYSILN